VASAEQIAATATAHGHAGELLQGALLHEGELRRFLVSLPAPALRSCARFLPSSESELRVTPVWKCKSARAAQLMLAALGLPRQGGALLLSDEIPSGRGLGSSTSDCVAAMRAVALHYGARPTEEQLARLAHQAEQASDSTMFAGGLTAFLHCEGRLLERLEGAIPKLRMLTVEAREKLSPFHTNEAPRPHYSHEQMECFARLLGQLRAAIAVGDLRALGAVASASAAINQEFFPKPHYEPIAHIAQSTQALGLAAAHTGTVLTLLYPEQAHHDDRIQKAKAQLQFCGLSRVRELCTWSDEFE
jgi:uncharacterized protein involved in propanediol utilization